MYLKEVIEFLKAQDPTLVLAEGFNKPHSYRGYYDELAFEPASNVTVGEMLTAAESALGQTFCGWKGGEYTMDEYTNCWLAEMGRSGEALGEMSMKYMLSTAVERDA